MAEKRVFHYARGRPEVTRTALPWFQDNDGRHTVAPTNAQVWGIARNSGGWVPSDRIKLKKTSLTPREREVLAWVAQGKSAREIAEILHIAKRTVDEHVQTAVRKLGALKRTHAVAIALRDAIIKV
jgi:DNA-binding CsgD family transcriptional regulator